jgi:hypothetical protein
MSSSPISKRARIAEHAFLAPAKAMVICSSIEEAGDGLKIGTHDGKVHRCCEETICVGCHPAVQP